MARLPLVVAIVVCVSAAVLGQPPGSARAVTLTGRVTALGTSDSLRGARVTVVSSGRSADPVFTDSRGRFRTTVPEGLPVTLEIAKAGFVTVRVTPPVQRSRDDAPPEVAVELAKGGVIAGRVFDADGAPVVDAPVHAEIVSSATGQRGPLEPAGTARTDDLGEYRIGGLVPGRYSVRVHARESNMAITFRNARDVGRVFLPPAAGSMKDAIAAVKTELDQATPAGIRVDVAEGVEVSVTHPLLQPTAPVNATADGVSAQISIVYTDRSDASGGVVTGWVTDEFGEPASGLTVDLHPLEIQSLRHVLGAGTRARVTDDRGQFRLFGVPPGTYYLAVTVSSASRSTTYAQVYYPGRLRLDEAIPLRVDKAQELGGVNVTFAAGRTVRLRGMVLDGAGRAGIVGGAALLAVVPGSVISLPHEEVSIATDGTFELADVAPGDYLLQVVGKGSSGLREMGVQQVSVPGAEAAPVIVSTSSGAKLSGTVAADSGRPIPAMVGLSVAPADPAWAALSTLYEGGFISAGAFELSNVIGPGRLALEGAPPGWWLKGVTIGGADVTDTPVVFGREDRNDLIVTIGTRGAEVRGRMSGITRSSPERPSVAVFPVDSARWFYRSRFLRLVHAAPEGGFSVTGLPPGDYWVAPVGSTIEERAYNVWQHPDFLNALIPVAVRVRLAEGQSVTVALQLGGSQP